MTHLSKIPKGERTLKGNYLQKMSASMFSLVFIDHLYAALFFISTKDHQGQARPTEQSTGLKIGKQQEKQRRKGKMEKEKC
jgi:hypothetical protein